MFQAVFEELETQREKRTESLSSPSWHTGGRERDQRDKWRHKQGNYRLWWVCKREKRGDGTENNWGSPLGWQVREASEKEIAALRAKGWEWADLSGSILGKGREHVPNVEGSKAFRGSRMRKEAKVWWVSKNLLLEINVDIDKDHFGFSCPASHLLLLTAEYDFPLNKLLFHYYDPMRFGHFPAPEMGT